MISPKETLPAASLRTVASPGIGAPSKPSAGARVNSYFPAMSLKVGALSPDSTSSTFVPLRLTVVVAPDP